MLIPVFTLFAPTLEGTTPLLMGIALGSYGLSQGLLQIPFGIFSDRFGRKKMITIGLILFALGSLLGALTHSIYGMILARILQGMGAIGSVLIALLADLTTERERTKAMAVIGMSIGLSFSLAMVFSPSITHYYGLSGIFYLTLLLALLGLILLHGIIRTPPKNEHTTNKLSLLKDVLRNRALQRLNGGIFIQHLLLTTTFFALPLLLQQQLINGSLTQQWHFYLPLMILSFALMVPFIIWAEKKHKAHSLFLFAILLIGSTQAGLSFFHAHYGSLWALMLLYFVAFNILEASLPSMISKTAPSHSKGTAMGVYSSSQFLGIFAGGLLAGFLFSQGISFIFTVNALIAFIWFFIEHCLTKKTLLFGQQNKV